MDVAAHRLLTRDIHKYSCECYLPYIKDETFFEDEYSMETYIKMMRIQKNILPVLRKTMWKTETKMKNIITMKTKIQILMIAALDNLD